MRDEDATKITRDGVYAHKGQPVITTEVMHDELPTLPLMVRMSINDSLSYYKGGGLGRDQCM